MNPGEAYLLPRDSPLEQMATFAGVCGLVGFVVCGAMAVATPAAVAESYLFAFLFWSGIPLGSLAILMLQHITGGAWGAVLRRILEAATRTLPLLAILFLPILFSTGLLFEWARPEVVEHDLVLQHKRAYLNVPFFAFRAVLYFVVWIVLSHFLSEWSRRQDRAPESIGLRLENISRGGLLLFVLTMTFASIDWAMSLEPHWYSTMYGILFIGGQVLSALAFVIPVTAVLAARPPMLEVMTADRFQDLGKLLLAFVMVWAYFSFSQFLIIWSADLPEETPWYLRRLSQGWQWAAIALIILHFMLPFVLLLSRDLKRSRRWLMAVAAVVLAMRAIDLSWLVLPAFDRGGLLWVPSDFAAFLGVGGLWFYYYVRQLRSAPMLPLNDESLPEMRGLQP